MANADTRVSKMARRRFSITTSPGSANLVHSPKTCEGDAGYLASLAFGHMGGRWSPSVGYGERHCRARAQRSHKSDLNRPYVKFKHCYLRCKLQEPFPALKFINFDTRGSLPNSFLGGSAPGLRHLYLEAVPFPTLPTLLLSATGLVTLSLRNVPHSGYISPESMAACLFPLTKLERLVLKFQSTLSGPDPERRNFPSPTRAALPALTRLEFKGVSDYFEDLVARIDATPVLDCLQITFFKQHTFYTPHLSQFVCRVPKFHALIGARVIIISGDVSVAVTSPTRTLGSTLLSVGVALRDLNWQPSSLARLCTSSLPVVLTAEHLYLTTTWAHWWQDIENTQWLELLLPFTSVKNLYLSKEFASHIVPSLQELVGEGVTKVLPALRNLFLAELRPSGHVQQAIGQFVSARQLFGHSITVFQWV